MVKERHDSELTTIIDRHLERLDWTRRNLAEKSGIAEEYLSRMMNGHRAPSPEHTHKIAEALGLGPVDYQELHICVARMHGFAV